MKRFRHELKYFINEKDYATLRDKISLVLTQDLHSVSRDGYLIRSLYFDNVYDHDLIQKNSGIFRRKKFRIRTYNYSEDVIKLEKKSRQGEYILKSSVSITREEYEQILDWDYDFLLKKTGQLYQEFYYYLTSSQMRPRVIVDYVREAYVGTLGNVRVTFDKELSFVTNSVDLFEKHPVSEEVLDYPKTILEVKYDEFLPEYVRQLLQLESHQRSAISKYVHCRMASIRYHGL